jgi:hypothetical protein
MADPRHNHSIPAGIIIFILLAFLFPKDTTSPTASLKSLLLRIDWLGLLLSIAASIILIIPLQEGGADYSWRSATVVAMVAVGGLCWIAFAGWEVFISRHPGEKAVLPMMPNRVAYQRVVGACIVYVH